MSRTWPSVVDRSVPVSMTKSARARFSASGIWRARIESSFSAVIPGRCEHARALHLAPARRRRHLVELLLAAVSNSSGMSNTSAGASAMLVDEAPRARRGPPDGRSLRARRAWRGSAEHDLRKALAVERSGADACRESSSPIFSTRAPPAPAAARTTASASNTGTPARSNIFATVDLPMPIEPVSAIRIMQAATRAREARRAAGATASRGW